MRLASMSIIIIFSGGGEYSAAWANVSAAAGSALRRSHAGQSRQSTIQGAPT